jgi:8-oxo-dGTP pyrophosphatase MutT (NUDIX family)
VTHAPGDDEERLAVEHTLRLLDAPQDPFLRSTLPAHITGSALVLDVRHRVVLLHRHRRLGIWLQPGGHVEPGEALAVLGGIDVALKAGLVFAAGKVVAGGAEVRG